LVNISPDLTHSKFKRTKFVSPALNLGAVTLAIVAGCASTSPAPAKAADGLLTGPNGMTLYTFDKDVAGSGKSTCNGPLRCQLATTGGRSSRLGQYSIGTNSLMPCSVRVAHQRSRQGTPLEKV